MTSKFEGGRTLTYLEDEPSQKSTLPITLFVMMYFGRCLLCYSCCLFCIEGVFSAVDLSGCVGDCCPTTWRPLAKVSRKASRKFPLCWRCWRRETEGDTAGKGHSAASICQLSSRLSPSCRSGFTAIALQHTKQKRRRHSPPVLRMWFCSNRFALAVRCRDTRVLA